MKTLTAATALALALAGSALAAEGQPPGAQSGMTPGQMTNQTPQQPPGAMVPGGGAQGMMQGGMMQGMQRMPRMDMAEQLGAFGDIDSDFVRMMAMHHQEAMAIARKQMADGSDPELKKMAEQMLRGQEKELSEMQDWAKRHGKQQVQ